MDKRKRLIDLLKVESIRPKKYTSGSKQVIIMPSPIQKRDTTNYAYSKDIDEKVVRMATSLAEKMAISMIRETQQLNIDKIVDKISESLIDKICAAMPKQQTIIQQVADSNSIGIKKEISEMVFETADIVVDRSSGLKLHGKIGEKTKSEESTDDMLDALDNLL